MSDDPEIMKEATRIVTSILPRRNDRQFHATEILLLVNKWKDKAYREGFQDGKESVSNDQHT